jgi:tetratricopeptide (TPR) repeat protein
MTRYISSRMSITLVVASLGMVLLTNPSSLFAAAGATDEYVEDAEKYIKKGDTNAAVIQLKNALQKDPNNVTARKMLGEIYLRVGNGPAAAKELGAAIRHGAKDKETHVLLARAYLLMGKFDDVLKTIPDDVSDPKIRLSVLLARARAHLGLRQFDESEQAFGAAEKLEPDDVRPKVGAAQVLVNRGKLKEAEAKVDAALEVQADSSDALVLKGELRRLNRDLEGAVAAFDKALSGRKVNIPARLGRAAALIDLNIRTKRRRPISWPYSSAVHGTRWRVTCRRSASQRKRISKARRKCFSRQERCSIITCRVFSCAAPLTMS